MTCIIKVETIVDTLFRKLVKKIRAVKYNMKNIPGFLHKKINDMHYDNKYAVMMITHAVDFISTFRRSLCL